MNLASKLIDQFKCSLFLENKLVLFDNISRDLSNYYVNLQNIDFLDKSNRSLSIRKSPICKVEWKLQIYLSCEKAQGESTAKCTLSPGVTAS